jgi:hypothetical protein
MKLFWLASWENNAKMIAHLTYLLFCNKYSMISNRRVLMHVLVLLFFCCAMVEYLGVCYQYNSWLEDPSQSIT